MGKWKHNLSTFRAKAREHGGACLSRKYEGYERKLKFRCKDGHEWEAMPQGILNGKWCRQCGYKSAQNKKRLTIEEMQILAIKNGGKCLSKKYINTDTALKWQCSKGHVWDARPDHIKAGSWCNKCAAIDRAKAKVTHNIKEFQHIARERSAKLLTQEYQSYTSNLRFECANGHDFAITPKNIFRGRWCPTCNRDSQGEIYLRLVFERIFKTEFPKTRPKWLGGLELDGYSEKLKLGFEHQGQQHYSIKRGFLKNAATFKAQKMRDSKKKRICAAHGVKIIEIPEIPTLLSPSDAVRLVQSEAEKTGYTSVTKGLPKFTDVFSVANTLQALREFAAQKGGKLLSNAFVNNRSQLLWRCKEGHEWSAMPGNVTRKSWCPTCAHKRNIERKILRSFSRIQKYVKAKGGEVTAKKFRGTSIHAEFRCRENHKWSAFPSNVLRGTWCPHCFKNGRALAKLRRIK